MKMKKIQYIGMVLCIMLAFSCRKDTELLDVDLSTYNSDSFKTGPVDEWIYNNLTVPYNVEVKYRFDRGMGDISNNIAPPELSKVQPVSEMILNGFIKVYEKIAGPSFIKTYTPKQFALWGSLTYRSNGVTVLGTADNGRRIVLYDINNLDLKNPAGVKRRLRTIYHEFTHILNQLVAIPPSFEQVTPGDYTGDWTNSANTDEIARDLGYVSRYARDKYTEDFAEMAAHLLVEGQVWFDLRVEAASAEGAAKLRQKESIVIDYFKQYFNIEFSDLQNEAANALDGISPPIPFSTIIQDGNIETLNNLNPLNQAHASAAFTSVWEDAVAGVAELSSRSLNEFSIIFNSPTDVTVSFEYNNTAGSNYLAYVAYDLVINGDGSFTFVPGTPGGDTGAWGNANVIRSGIQPVLDYLENNTFRADWVTQFIPGSAGIFGGFFEEGNPDAYFYGSVE